MRHLFTIALMLLMAQTSLAQNGNCGNGLPCGSIPWDLPDFPKMESPTPIPDIYNDPSAPPQATATATMSSTEIADLDTAYNSLATIESIMQSTPVLIEIEGTPTNADDYILQTISDSETMFSYIKGLSSVSFGKMQPLIEFTLIAFPVVFLTMFSKYFIIIGAVVLGFIRKILTLLFDFLPL